MTVPDQHKLIRAQIRRQVFLFMGHTDAKPAQLKIQELRQRLRPILVRIAAHGVYGRDLPKLRQNLRTADISCVENDVGAASTSGRRRSCVSEIKASFMAI